MTESESIPVIGKDGARGVIVGHQSAESGVSHALVRLDTGEQVLVPIDVLVLQADGSYYYAPFNLHDITAEEIARLGHDSEKLVVPVIAEELDIQKRTVETGRVRVHKSVREREEEVDVPLLREEVHVERVPVNRVIDQAVGVRYEGETLIIPVLEEVLVVEKRLMLREELHVTRRQVETRHHEEVTLRSEEVRVEHVDPPARMGSAEQDEAS
jgi:uncharacterized protein (TIGR02271 family)